MTSLKWGALGFGDPTGHPNGTLVGIRSEPARRASPLGSRESLIQGPACSCTDGRSIVSGSPRLPTTLRCATPSTQAPLAKWHQVHGRATVGLGSSTLPAPQTRCDGTGGAGWPPDEQSRRTP